MNRFDYIFFSMAVMLFASCSTMKQGVGLRGIVVDDDRITLDGDTFEIQERIGDSLLIVSKERFTEGVPDYLMKIESNGFYYIKTKADNISSIDNTKKFVVFGNRDVYDISKNRTLFRTACDISCGLSYLGTFDNIHLFANNDSLSFSDGKYLELQPEVYCRAIVDSNLVKLTFGAESIDLSPKELYQCSGKKMENDKSVCHFKKGYFVKPHSEDENDGVGYDVDIEMPIGSDVAGIAVRQWIMTQIRNDLFSMLEVNPEEMLVPTCNDVDELGEWLDKYGVMWEKLIRHNYQDEDSILPNFNSNIMIRKIVDNTDYTTYYFSSNPYLGGMHELPRSYYATYDKRRKEFLKGSNTIKASARKKIVMAALRSIKKQYDELYGKESKWDDFINTMCSFCCPLNEEEKNADEALDETYGGLYWCDKAAEWNCDMSPNDVSGFPLPHFAIIPEGIVFTYHPYQIDCFAAGEYHAVIPLKDCVEYLQYEYKQCPSPVGLSTFIKMK